MKKKERDGNKAITRSINFKPDLLKELIDLAEKEDRSVSGLVCILLKKALTSK